MPLMTTCRACGLRHDFYTDCPSCGPPPPEPSKCAGCWRPGKFEGRYEGPSERGGWLTLREACPECIHAHEAYRDSHPEQVIEWKKAEAERAELRASSAYRYKSTPDF